MEILKKQKGDCFSCCKQIKTDRGMSVQIEKMEMRMKKLWNDKKSEGTGQIKDTKKIFGKKKTNKKEDVRKENVKKDDEIFTQQEMIREESDRVIQGSEETKDDEKTSLKNSDKKDKRFVLRKNKADKKQTKNTNKKEVQKKEASFRGKKDRKSNTVKNRLMGQKTATKPKRKLRIFNFSRRLLAMSFLPMIFTCIIVTSISSHTLKSAMESELENAMRIAAISIEETYTNLYKGDYSQSLNGAIKKGDVEISGNYDLVDAMSKETSFDITMMFGNMRLLTTVKNESKARANGTSTDEKVYARVEKGEKVFLRDFPVEDKICYVYYEPLKNSDGSVFGAVEVAEECSKVQKTINKQVQQLVLLSVLIVIAVCAISLLVSRRMVQKMMRIKRFLDRIIEGKLDHKVHQKTLRSNDEIGDIYRSCVELQETFRKMVGGIKESGDSLKISADELSDTAQRNTAMAFEVRQSVIAISERAKDQAESTEDALGSVDTINVQMEQILVEVEAMARKAEEMSQKEKESEEIIMDLSVSSDDTKTSVLKATDQIALMYDAVNDIHKAVELIQSIADETDLLSINANIEAARAGEAGKGFAVVADQINKLAIQSNHSSMDIQKMLERVTQITQSMVDVMHEVSSNMDVQQEKLVMTRNAYQVIADGVEQSRTNMGNIRQKVVVLNTSGADISDAIGELSRSADDNAKTAADTMQTVNDMSATMQQVQSSSKELMTTAAELQETLGSFRM